MSNPGSIRYALEHPPSLRRNGWDMGTYDQAKIQRGEFIRVANGDRIAIDLYRDGTFIFATTADSNFLAWGRESESLKINPLALVEVIYSFVDFYRLVLGDFVSPPERITFRIDLQNMHLDGATNYLVPHSLKSPP